MGGQEPLQKLGTSLGKERSLHQGGFSSFKRHLIAEATKKSNLLNSIKTGDSTQSSRDLAHPG